MTTIETTALRDWLGEHRPKVLTSSIGIVELTRAATRSGALVLAAARALADRVSVVQLSGRTLELAALLPPAALRALDAVHLATALMVEDLDVVLGYDRRLLDAASGAGLRTASPGW